MLFRENRTILWLLAVSVLTAAMCVFVFFREQDTRWEAMTTRIARLRAEARSRNVSRSVLHGQPRPGNAWDEYNIALADALTWSKDPNGATLARFLSNDPTVDHAIIDRMIGAHAGMLEHLGLGAQRSDGQYPYRWEDGALMEIPSLLASRKTAVFAAVQARIWMESGRAQETADLLLDVSVFGRDLATNGTILSILIGDAVSTISFDELRNLVLSGKLTRIQLADLEKKLELVDRDFASLGPTLANENLASSDALMDMPGTGPSVRGWLNLMSVGGWRYGFSSERMTVDAFEEREFYSLRSQKFDQMDFASAKKEAEAITAEAEQSKNPLIRLQMPSFPKPLISHRETLARLRLLRAGTGFLATGKVPTLGDPFGKDLLHAQEAGKLKIWSVGKDGVNQNGVEGDLLLEILGDYFG